MEYIFVYGTLLSFFKHPLTEKLKSEGEFVGKAKARGILYDAGEYPVAIPSSDSIIHGEVYKIPEVLFFDLDDYEDNNIYEPENSLFLRKRTKLILDTGEKIFGWIYWFNRDFSRFPKIPDGDYIKYKIYKTFQKQ